MEEPRHRMNEPAQGTEEPTQEMEGPGCHPTVTSCPCPSWNPQNVTPGLPSLVPSSVLARATWRWMVHLSSSTHRRSLPALLWSLLPRHKRTNISLCKANYLLLFIPSGSHGGRGSVTQPSYSSSLNWHNSGRLLPPILILILSTIHC